MGSSFVHDQAPSPSESLPRPSRHPAQCSSGPGTGSNMQAVDGRPSCDQPTQFTVDDALTSVGFGRYQWLLLGYTGLAWAAEAMELLLLSFVGPAAASEWVLEAGEEAMLSSVVFGGMLLGAYGWGTLADAKGRRLGFSVTAVFTAFAGLASALAPNFGALLVTRALVGVGLGGAPVVFSLFMEFVPPRDRGFWLIGVSLFWTVGSVVEAGLAWAVLPTLGWRWLVGFSTAPFLLLLLCFPLLPESPRFLLTKGREVEALAVLGSVAGINGKGLPAGELLGSTALVPAWDAEGPAGPGEGVPSGGQHEGLERRECPEGVPLLAAPGNVVNRRGGGDKVEQGSVEDGGLVERGWASSKEQRGVVVGHGGAEAPSLSGAWRGLWGALCRLRLLFAPPLRRTTVLLWGVFFANAFSYYGLVLLTTQVSSSLGLPCPAPSPSSLPAAIADPSDSYRDILITSAGELPGLLLAAFLVDRIGRKGTMAALLFSASLCSFALLFLFQGPLARAPADPSSPAAAVTLAIFPLGEAGVPPGGIALLFLFLARACVMGAFQTSFSYAPEVYPTSVRTTGLGAANAFSRLGGVACPYVAVSLFRSCNQELAFALFGFVPLLASFASLMFPMETCGRSLDEDASSDDETNTHN